MNTAVRVYTNQETGMCKYTIVERVFSDLDQDDIDGNVLEDSGFIYGEYFQAKHAGELAECNY